MEEGEKYMFDNGNDFIQEREENFGRSVKLGLTDEDIPRVDVGEKGQKSKGNKRYTITKKGIALIACVCIFASGIFGFSGAMIANGISNGSSLGTGTLPEGSGYSQVGYNLETATGSEMTIQEIIALNANAVVEIRTEAVATDMWMQQYVTEGAGSGVIISSDGYIMTNNHVISGASKINVTLKGGTSYEATLVGTDSETDVAVLKIKATGLTSAVYGDSQSLMVGDLAVAIGNPLGELGGTATAGIISALDRELTVDGKTMTLLQTDASINPGNSGGGLFNQYGELIGLVVAKSTGSDVEGLGFAIPINDAKAIAEELVNNGYVKGRPYIGISYVDLTSARNAVMYGVRNTGIYIKSVDSQNAKAAGLEAGDMLYYVGDTKITSAADLTSAINSYKVGDKVKIVVVRDNETKTLTLTMGEKTN